MGVTAEMNDLEAYLSSGLDQVHGWLDSYSARFIADLADVQRNGGVTGAFGEIGVHHGKLFILLRLAAQGDPGFAVDVFGKQELNTDRSGRGDRDRFEGNIQRWAPGGGKVTVFERSSLDISPSEILDAVGPCRLVSVDGGHTAECAFSDLKLAEAVLSDGGVAILDDYFNPHWPDVSTGTARYCLDVATSLRPFAITPNKVMLARPRHHETLLSALLARHEARLVRRNRMFGHEVSIFEPSTPMGPPSEEVLNQMLSQLRAYPARFARHAFVHSPLGPAARRVRDALGSLARGRR